MSLFEHAPRFSAEAASGIALESYGLKVAASALPSERDQNFLLRDENGRQFVLKIANATEDLTLLEAQNAVMRHLAGRLDLCPRVMPALDGSEIVTVASLYGALFFVRVVTYLPGSPLGELKRHSPELLYDLGFKIGQLDAALQGFDHPAAHRDFHWDLANGLKVIRQYGRLIAEPALRELVIGLAADFEWRTGPLLPRLRTSLIHNDANDYNILVGGGDDLYSRNQYVVGLIDFGDMLHSYTVGDLALALAYAILDKPDPLATAAEITRGYHAAFPLSEDELAVLFGLVRLRLCVSAALAAEQQRRQPENAYLGISQTHIRATLPVLANIHPRLAEAVLRQACGMPAARSQVAAWLAEHPAEFASPLDPDPRQAPVLVFDLGMGSPTLSADPAQNTEVHLTPRLAALMQEAGAQVGIGQYDEARYFYTSPEFATGSAPTDEFRSVHLGIDLFAAPGTPVLAPLDGVVAAWADNAVAQDYGPVVVLKHQAGDESFYTLYGHLSRKTLEGLQVGQSIHKGQRFAELGSAQVNGGWTPHLHFQIITDLLDLGSDFPGLARPSQR